jgi:hypothetical protein
VEIMSLEERVRDVLSQANPERDAALDPWEVIRLGRRRRRGAAVLRFALASLLVIGVATAAWMAMPRGATPVASTAAQSSTQPSDAPAVVVAYDRALLTWVGCLRDHGITVSDPPGNGPDTEWLTQLGKNKGDPAYEAASQACASLVPVVTPDLEHAWGQNAAPLLSVQQVQAEQAYADCMRGHGASSFPTPGTNGITPDQWAAWSTAVNEPASAAALKACGPFTGH